MSVNPIASWVNNNTPQFLDLQSLANLPNISTNSINLSTLTASVNVSTINLNTSTINGLAYPPPSALGNIQTAQNNPPSVSGKVITNTGAYIPLLSTTQTFNFIENSVYDINLPAGLNVSLASDHPFNLFLGSQVQGDAYYTTSAVLNIEANQNQVVDNIQLRQIRSQTLSNASLPLVFGCFAQGLNPTSTITVSANLTASALSLIAVNKLT